LVAPIAIYYLNDFDKLRYLLFFFIIFKNPDTAGKDQKKPQEIETKGNHSDFIFKKVYGFNLGYNLRNPEKHPDPNGN